MKFLVEIPDDIVSGFSSTESIVETIKDWVELISFSLIARGSIRVSYVPEPQTRHPDSNTDADSKTT
jgi:hypothetical protein